MRYIWLILLAIFQLLCSADIISNDFLYEQIGMPQYIFLEKFPDAEPFSLGPSKFDEHLIVDTIIPSMIRKGDERSTILYGFDTSTGEVNVINKVLTREINLESVLPEALQATGKPEVIRAMKGQRNKGELAWVLEGSFLRIQISVSEKSMFVEAVQVLSEEEYEKILEFDKFNYLESETDPQLYEYRNNSFVQNIESIMNTLEEFSKHSQEDSDVINDLTSDKQGRASNDSVGDIDKEIAFNSNGKQTKLNISYVYILGFFLLFCLLLSPIVVKRLL